jgi:hypothetical protein
MEIVIAVIVVAIPLAVLFATIKVALHFMKV